MVNGSRFSNVGANSDASTKADLNSTSLAGVACHRKCFRRFMLKGQVLCALDDAFWLFTGVSVQEEDFNSGAQHIPLMDEEHLDTDSSTDKVWLCEPCQTSLTFICFCAWPLCNQAVQQMTLTLTRKAASPVISGQCGT